MTPTESAAVDDRVRALQWRTTGVGWVATIALAGAAAATLLALGDLGHLIAGSGADDIAAFHVPRSLRHSENLPLLSMLFAALALAGGWGLSTGRLRQSHSYTALALCVLVGAADFLLAAPLHKPLFVLPSRVERLVSDGEHAEADRRLAEIGDDMMRRRAAYVRAQIALRAGDTQRLETLGRPLLNDADDYVYAGKTDPGVAHGYFEMIGDLRIEVLATIDRRLNGTPTSAAGIAGSAERSGRSARWLSAGTTTASAIGLLAAGLMLMALWRRMRANVLRIIDLID
ncbi:MAG: hypothetical protein ACOYLX_15075 [Burkholderiaceae bacterium]